MNEIHDWLMINSGSHADSYATQCTHTNTLRIIYINISNKLLFKSTALSLQNANVSISFLLKFR